MTLFLVHYALNALWQVPLLAITCSLVVRLLRPGLLTAHLLWIATLLLAVAMPFHGWRNVESVQPAFPNPAPLTKLGPLPTPGKVLPFAEKPAASASPSHLLSLRTFAIPIPIPIPMPHASGRSITLLATLYLFACLVACYRLLAAAWVARRLYRTSTPALLSSRQALIVAQLTAHFEVDPPLIRTPALTTTGPLLTGLAEPALLLPAAIVRAAPEQFATVIAHELAHLRRHDLAVNLLLRVAALPIAYHPATMLLHARIRHTRELLTDRLAASALRSPNAYAQGLLEISQQLVKLHANPPLAAGLFEQPSLFAPQPGKTLEDRIMKLIAAPAPRLPLYLRIARLTASAALFAGALTATSLLHLTPVAFAAQQSTPAAPAPYTPAPQEIQTSSDGTRTASSSVVTPTSNTQQTYTARTRAGAAEPTAITALPQPPVPPVPPQPAAITSLPDPQLDAITMQSLEATRRQLDSPEFKLQMQEAARSVEAARRQLNSPEFKLQLRQASEAAAKVHLDMPAMQIQFQNLSQLNDPAFRAKFAQAEKAQAMIAGLKLDPAFAQAQLPSPAERDALRAAFHQRLAQAKQKLHEQIHAAGSDQAKIDQATEAFVAETQLATTIYTNGLTSSPSK